MNLGVTQKEAEDFYNAMKDPKDETPVSYGLNSRLTRFFVIQFAGTFVQNRTDSHLVSIKFIGSRSAAYLVLGAGPAMLIKIPFSNAIITNMLIRL